MTYLVIDGTRHWPIISKLFLKKSKVTVFQCPVYYNFRVSTNSSVFLLLSYYLVTATIYITVHIDMQFLTKNRL